MATIDQIIARYVREAGKDNPRYLSPKASNVFARGHNLYSYGMHFILACFMPDNGRGEPWWLLNGDNYSPSTARHQTYTRRACEMSGRQIMILPFSTLHTALIDRDTIRPVNVTADGYETITHHASTLADVPVERRYVASMHAMPAEWWARETADGWTWETQQHTLGASLFDASYVTRAAWAPGAAWDERAREETRTHARFLSAFDAQESRHYFLCQLPDGCTADTVTSAFNALRPASVLLADTSGVPVTRQGDIFAIPQDMTTRDIRRVCPDGIVKRGQLLGQSHVATETAVSADGTTYARGCLYHAPTEYGRAPEHRRQRMGNGRQWHLIIKNTVPVDARGQNRAWSIAGNVD